MRLHHDCVFVFSLQDLDSKRSYLCVLSKLRADMTSHCHGSFFSASVRQTGVHLVRPVVASHQVHRHRLDRDAARSYWDLNETLGEHFSQTGLEPLAAHLLKVVIEFRLKVAGLSQAEKLQRLVDEEQFVSDNLSMELPGGVNFEVRFALFFRVWLNGDDTAEANWKTDSISQS